MPANTPSPRQTVGEEGSDYTARTENAPRDGNGPAAAETAQPASDRSEPAPNPPIARDLEPDYEAILAAVSESARGRWFLEEYARHNRTADTEILLDALDRLERRMDRQSDAEDVTHATALRDISAAIARARVEIAGAKSPNGSSPDRPDPGAVRFAAEAEAGRMAAMTLKTAGDRIGAIGTALRQYGVPAEHCEILQRYAAGISSAAGVMTGLDVMGRALEQIEAAIGDPLPSADADIRPDAADTGLPAFSGSIALDDVAFVDLAAMPAEDAAAASSVIEPRLPDLAEPGPVEPDPIRPAAIENSAFDQDDASTGGPNVRRPRPISIRPRRPALRPTDLTGLTFDQKMILFS